MRVRRRLSPLLLLLLPAFASAVSSHSEHVSSVERGNVLDAPEEVPSVIPTNVATSLKGAKGKSEVGTKDAPVDGQDGKPHAGPWVEAGSGTLEREKTVLDAEDGEPAPARKPVPRPLTDPTIPEVNDGVMDDPNREGPKKGTTGTEGGVSEKERDRKAQEQETDETAEKIPSPPKEAPPLPHSEAKKIKGSGGAKNEETESPFGAEKLDADDTDEAGKVPYLGGLAKPTDLPEKPSDSSSSVSPPPKTFASENTQTVLDDGHGMIQPLHSFVLSFTMILFSEIGDKTFLIAALMAMKHPRLLVFSAAFSALIAMTILSAVLGHAVPTLIPKRFTNLCAALLFLVFGAKMLREGYLMAPDEGVSEEMKEVEMELEEKAHLARRSSRRRSSVSPYVLESGRAKPVRGVRSNSRLPSPPRSPSSSRSPSPASSPATTAAAVLTGLNNLFSLLLSPAWVQTFVMTFLGEWGDRSQIATIAMAAGQDYWWVTGGAVSGHGICTAAAVVGGRAIAGRVSLRVVTLGGAFAFIVFGVIYLAEALFYA
ncbi:MAG: hypothetical protein M1825_003746 [Sarcosagium campestre]|nr:MAG: hypothetical protein M1825_003746 [Sarcosagium campestre]